jgi:hypothetical protein
MARWLHATEVASTRTPGDLRRHQATLDPGLPGTLICMESTAKGQGNYFHQQWDKAEQGESDYVPFFVPWPVDPYYRCR